MDNLRSSATRALAWDMIGTYGAQLSGFIISIFLARLLEPADFGLVGMSLVFLAILQIFKDLGFSSALIQSEKNNSLTYSSVFYINVGVGIVLTFLLFFSAPLIGAFYDNATVSKLVRLLSIGFLISSLNNVHIAILNRELDFKTLTKRNLISQGLAGILAIILAFNDYGIYALVIQHIAASVLNTILLWYTTEWRPKLEFSFSEIRKLSHFSFYVFAAASVNKLIQQLDTLIIGKLFSPSTLGYFSRANSLNTVIIQSSSTSISNVFFPTLSKVKDDSERFDRLFFRVVEVVASFSIYLTAIFFLTGQELIIGLFGMKWLDSIPIFQILILKGFTYPISLMIVNAFMAKGRSKENFYFGNIRKVLQLLPFGFAIWGGLIPFLYANIGVAILIWILNTFFAHYSLNLSLIDQFKAVTPYLLFSFVLVLIIEFFSTSELSYGIALIKLLSFSVLYFLFLWIMKSPILIEIKTITSKFKSPKQSN